MINIDYLKSGLYFRDISKNKDNDKENTKNKVDYYCKSEGFKVAHEAYIIYKKINEICE